VPAAVDVSAPCGIGAALDSARPAETHDRASVLWLWRVAAGFLTRRNIRVKPFLIGCFPFGFLEQELNLALEGILVHHPEMHVGDPGI
jgi:hypothetical protein